MSFSLIPKRKCRATFDVKDHTGRGLHTMKCLLRAGHEGSHLDQHGTWWNRNAFLEEVSRHSDNPNAKSATGKAGRLYIIGGK